MHFCTKTPVDKVVPFLIFQPSLALKPCVLCWQATIQPFHRRPSPYRTFSINSQSSVPLPSLPSLSPGEMEAAGVRGKDHLFSLPPAASAQR